MVRARAMWWAFGVLIAGGVAAAQGTPEPAWTSEEAAVPGFLVGIANSGACERGQPLPWLVNQHTWNVFRLGPMNSTKVDFGGYRYRVHSLAAETAPKGAGPSWLL